MSSKVGQSQPQGRRTPLSLTGGKHAHQQQQQQNNKNSNLSKIQEMKSEAPATPAATTAKNGNSNVAKNAMEMNNGPHKEHNNKKSAQQQNGNGNGNSEDVVIVVNMPGKDEAKNGGSANGHKNNKNGVAKTDTAKDKDNNKETAEATKEKPKKQEKTNASATAEKQQNEAPTATENANKPAEAAKPPTSDKKQNTSNIQKPATPTKAVTERGTATPPTKSPASKSSTPTKSPRIAAAAAAAAVANKSANGVQGSPAKETPPSSVVEPSPVKQVAEINPTATSTPGKVLTTKRGAAKAEKKETASNNSSGGDSSPIQSAIPRAYSAISGRRSIRPIEEFTPQMYNSQFRESYRRINTELDVTGNTNTSMNVTVGSEIPNNSSFLSFSLFGGRGRKREHTPPRTLTQAKSQSAVELTTNDATTPTKRARLDMHGIFTAMSSPLTLLRTRFSKTTLESSTPAKAKVGDGGEELLTDDVQNVSGVSIEEVAVCNSSSQNATEIAAAAEEQHITLGKEAEKTTPNKKSEKSTPLKSLKSDSSDIAEQANNSKDAAGVAEMDVDSDIQIKETPIIAAVGDPKAKQRGCLIM